MKTRLQKLTFAAAVAFITLASSCQNPPIDSSQAPFVKQWDKTFGGDSYERLQAIASTSDGGYLLGGISESTISGDKSQSRIGFSDYWIVKISSDGTKLWDKTFGGLSKDELRTIVPISDGGFLLGGSSDSNPPGNKSQGSKGGLDYWIVKISADGTKLWDRTFGGNNSDYLETIVPSSNGGYLLGGYTESTISGDKSQNSKGSMDYWIVKISDDGMKLWDKTLGGSDIDYLKAIVPTSEGGFLLGGYSTSLSSGDKSQDPSGFYDYWIVKVNANGTKLWDKTFGGKSDEYFDAIAPNSDSGFLLGGYSNSVISGDKSQDVIGDLDYWVIKIK